MSNVSRRVFLQGTAAVVGIAAAGGHSLKAFGQESTLKVGVAHQGPIGDVGWEKQHALGREAMEAAFPGKIKTTVVTGLSQAQDAERIFRELAVKGHKLIFGTTFSHMAPLLKVAK